MNNQTIDGVLVSRELLERFVSDVEAHNYGFEGLDEVRAILDSTIPSAPETESPGVQVSGITVDEYPKTGVVFDRPKNCEDRILPTYGEKERTHGEPAAVFEIDHTGYRCKVVLDPSKPFPPNGAKLYSEQPAPVVVVLPDRDRITLAAPLKMPKGYALDGSLEYELQIWRACLDEVTRLNTK